MQGRERTLPDWALLVACALPFLGFWTYGLFDLDEGFYGAVARDMIRRSDWVTPTLNGQPWFEKPILAYWLAIPCLRLFGEQVGPRLPSVACTLSTVWLVFWLARRRFGERQARLAALTYATNVLVVGIGRMMMTDAPLVLCLSAALVLLWERDMAPRSACLVGALVGLGVLAKGPVAAVLFLGILVATLWRVPSLRDRIKRGWLVGLLACLGVVALWYVPAYLANGRLFVDKFLIEQNVGRFTGGDRAHAVPVWSHPIYYPFTLALSLLPWCLFLLGRSPDRAPVHDEGQDTRTFLWIWALVPLAFFSLSGSKLPHYILPAVPPLAILLADRLSRTREAVPFEQIGLGWSACLLVLAQAVSTAVWSSRMKEVQDAAKIARDTDEPLVVYKLGGTGDTSISTTLRETSHPSILFYLRRPATVTDDPASLQRPDAYLVLTTRSESSILKGQLGPGRNITQLEAQPGGRYVLLQVSAETVPAQRRQ